MSLLFKPFGMVVGLVARKASTEIFDQVWRRVDGGPLPDSDVREDPAGRAIVVAALQAAIFAGTTAAVSRYGMHVYEHTFGHWPGDHREPTPEELEA